MKKRILLSAFSLVFSASMLFAQTRTEREQIVANYDLEKLSQLETEFYQKAIADRDRAFAKAEAMGWEKVMVMPNGGVALLVGILENGNPKYYVTTNREAAITTRTDRVHSGGGAGLDLNGENMIMGVWDGGRVRATHPLLADRITQVDDPSSYSDHSTHVSGTMVGTGEVINGAAKGMAPEAEILAYDFAVDAAEMVGAAANGMLLSNHSYGMNIINASLWQLGFYSTSSRGVDNIAFNAPYYLTVWAAGNDRQSGVNVADGGYDYLTEASVSKNNLVVAATYEVLNYSGPNSVNMSSFSSWGPADDGRIKPDIAAKGVNMFSSIGTVQYGNMSGTSMAAPNVTGSLILLQQHYNNLYNGYMRSSTLKGLAIHTADETGNTPGPDYRFGWGLLNTEKAAAVITNKGTTSQIIEEELENGEVYTFNVKTDGTSDLVVSITWIDPPGNVLPSGIEDDPTPSLINDLDLRVSNDGGVTFYPWKLNPASFTAAATNGDNIVDNVEKIDIAFAPAGDYVIQVSHKDIALVNSVQAFSLIVSGIVNEDFLVSSHSGVQKACTTDDSVSYNIDLGFDEGATGTVNFTAVDLPAGTTGSITPSSLNGDGSVVLTLDGVNNLSVGEYSFKVIADSGSEEVDIYLELHIFDAEDILETTLTYPADNAVDLPIVITFTWEPVDNAINYDFELSRYSDFSDIEFSENVLFPEALILGVTEGAEYFWRVKANAICSEGNFSETYSFTVAGELGIDDELIENLVIYPNPTNNVLNISASTIITKIEVMNVLGQVLISEDINTTNKQVDVSALSTGNYFVRVTSNNSSNVLQVVKQ